MWATMTAKPPSGIASRDTSGVVPKFKPVTNNVDWSAEIVTLTMTTGPS